MSFYISLKTQLIITKTILGQPRKRLTHVYDLIKGKKICEGGDEMDLNPDNPDQNNAVQQVVYFISSAVPLSFVAKVGLMPCTTSYMQ